jgi:CRP-like cAMP-binding protein
MTAVAVTTNAVSAAAQTLKRVPFLALVDEATLERLVRVSRRVHYRPRQILVSELEPGADVYVILSGDAEVSVDARDGSRTVLRKLGPGSAFGEMSSLTGELRSATIAALTEVDALIIADAEFDQLRETRPQVALSMARELAERLHAVEHTLEQLLGRNSGRPPAKPSDRGKAAKGSLVRAWRELVVARQRDLAFITLAAFVGTLVAVRLSVHYAFRFDLTPRELLRVLYMSGFALLGGSACTSVLTFRPTWRRWIALAYGIGLALILNELGVTLAFDIFFKDIHTADPNVAFDVERLYRRAESLRAIAIGLVILVQAAYLRRFYVRAWFVLMTRLRRLRG